MDDGTYKLDELARAAGTSARTVRYYVQRGLLPAPQFRGKDTAYGADHLVRLKAIRRLQEAYFPLDAIAVELAGRSPREIARIADGSELPAGHAPPAPPAAAQAPPPPAARAAPRPLPPTRTWRRLEVAAGVELALADDAPPESQKLAARIVEILEAMSHVKEGA